MSIIDSKCFALNDTGKSVQIFPILIDMFCISARYPGCMGGWGGVTIGEIFVLIYFMFQGIWISSRGLYFLVQN